jgi:hypothetical protein
MGVKQSGYDLSEVMPQHLTRRNEIIKIIAKDSTMRKDKLTIGMLCKMFVKYYFKNH